MTTVVFATSRLDAKALCEARGLVFDEVIWVLNDLLLGATVVDAEVVPYYTDLFMEMPAYLAALHRFGDEPMEEYEEDPERFGGEPLHGEP